MINKIKYEDCYFESRSLSGLVVAQVPIDIGSILKKLYDNQSSFFAIKATEIFLLDLLFTSTIFLCLSKYSAL